MTFALTTARLRRTRQMWRAERKLLDVLLDSLDVAVVACGADGKPTHLNRRAVELMGMDGSTGSDPDTWTEQLWPRTPEGMPVALKDLPIVRALRGEVVRDVDVLLKTGRGEVLMRTSANPVYDDDGLQLGAIAVFADVTEQRAREAEMRKELRAVNLAVDMEDAIAAGHLVLYAQPIVDVATGETVMEELLLRVRSRDGAFVGPCEFLEVAQRHGKVAAVDEWVFQQAAQAAAAGRAVTVNVSARTVERSSFLELVERTLERDGVEPWLITFEITETTVISDIVGATRFAERLEAIGCRFALDDFGTGYAGMTYVKHIPVQYLKIDLEFVRDLIENERSRAVVSGIVGLAMGLGVHTIAEGVENAATLVLLRELGVDLAQGFHLGRPTPIATPPPGTFLHATPHERALPRRSLSPYASAPFSDERVPAPDDRRS
ncbi:MAG TPA: EAL domain-containing protein [Solirubrobacteraceae bacterium]|jgi:EAL domain-containing protein (putative c-di-GMP-specific phosphodiesterase class I)|nr:EAL domain-containing protein [Solirubrobacteraceae bacterium]